MKALAQNYKTGEIALLETPVPACRPGGLLVRSEYSLVSSGTELMKVSESKLSLVGKARARPDQVKKVVETARQQGLLATYQKVSHRLDSYTPLGYSLSGTVEEVGPGTDGFAVGDRVACGGSQFALHAEFNWVPRNLCVHVPEGVGADQAAFTTVGSIAMQALRQSEARLGEVACVIGLGLLGQLLCQLLRAAGVRTIGYDIAAERCRLAEELGALACGVRGSPSGARVEAVLRDLTAGAGADHVFLTAGGSSNEPVELAAALTRDRARIVDVGKCRLDLPWKEYYEKELEVRFSRSYGPGRYDPNYEERGIDYPIGYVRWTERRNMACFVDLLGRGELRLEPLISRVFPFSDAPQALERMNRGEISAIGVLFRYDPESLPSRTVLSSRWTEARPRRSLAEGIVRIGAIGCGNYASTMLLPHLEKRDDVRLVQVATRSALSSANAARRHGFVRMSTDHQNLLAADDVDAVLILTRHGSHAALVCEALRAGKTVFVEKPLAINEEQLASITRAVQETGNDRLMVGFNRRFAPLLEELKKAWGRPAGPQSLHYRVNAGRLAADSWYADAKAHGSRFEGEGGHFIDTLSWWLESDPVEVYAAATPDDPDNLIAIFRYADESIGTVSYMTNGDSRFPKEQLEIFGQGAAARLDNFSRTELWRDGRSKRRRSLLRADKGQEAEVAAFVEATRSGGPMPISFDSLCATTQATFAARRSAMESRPLTILPPFAIP
ncbi:MAG TPA: bi-domain-containing oxidoreductase [Gemmatimonadota bacterium]|nr:bi-domain-containing oxidoreductase [Gemmatimonadota bacterium]